MSTITENTITTEVIANQSSAIEAPAIGATKKKRSWKMPKVLNNSNPMTHGIDENTEVTRKVNAKARVFRDSSPNDTMTINGSDRFARKPTAREVTLAELLSSARAGAIRTATINGINPIMRGNKQMILLECNYKGFKIIIPAEHFMEVKPEFETALYKLCERRIGSEIDFVVDKIDPIEDKCIASRITAMSVKRKQFWFGTIKGSGDYHIQDGQKAEARIVSVGRGSIYVEVFGAETAIPLAKLSYTRISDARNYFRVGDTVNVTLNEIERDKKKNTVKFNASVKDAMDDPRKSAFNHFAVGGTYAGTATSFDYSNGNGVYVTMAGYGIECLCYYPDDGMTVMIGDNVRVNIGKKDEDRLFLFGKITHSDHIILG